MSPRPLLILGPAVMALSMLGGCSDQHAPAAPSRLVTAIHAPSNPHDDRAWQAYFKYVIAHEKDPNRDVVVFYLPAADTPGYDKIYRARIQEVHDAVARGIRPDTVMAFETSDPSRSADFVIDAVRDLPPDSMFDAIVFFISKRDDRDRVDRVWQALTPLHAGMTCPQIEMIEDQARKWAADDSR